MNADESTSAATLDTTLTNEPHRGRQRESEVIDLAANEARRAALAAWNDLNQSLREAIDPRSMARAHPWWTLGAASALGFAFGTGICSPAASQAHDKHRSATHEPQPAESTATDNRYLWFDHIFDLAKVAISSGIATLVQAHSAKTSDHSVPPATEPTTS